MALAENEIDGLIAALKAARVDAIAVSLVFSFLNPEHERQLGVRLRAELPDVPVYLSSDVLPEIKEFERTSTTAVCAYVGPILASYLARLEQVTRSRALPPLYLMGSNGGILEAAEAVAMPAMAVESGPAAGVVAAALVARQTGRQNLLSFDMGGTTAKASLIREGHYETTPEYEVGGGSSMTRWMNGTGHPIRMPVIDLAEVSAGGGSIAWVDRAGALRVGPRAPAPCPVRRATPAAAASLRSPIAISCSAIWIRDHCSTETSASIMEQPKPPCATGLPSRSALICAPPRPRSSTWSTTRWQKCSRSYPCNAATIRVISCSPPSAGRDRCMPLRSPASSASPR